jgi:hypothetical protein
VKIVAERYKSAMRREEGADVAVTVGHRPRKMSKRRQA